jgi:hypothetical protein
MGGLKNYLPQLASNLSPPDLSPSSRDYKREAPVPGQTQILRFVMVNIFIFFFQYLGLNSGSTP